VRPWQHVLDALAGYLLLAERLHASSEWAEPWNFGPDGVETVGWVVERVSARWGLAVEVIPPADAVEAPALRLDSTKARSRLGWEPRLDLAAALDATVSWHDEVRNGAAARAVTLSEIEAAS
jgi:CDP-glucose 4,6-dehydratase